jgi:hypothetical protein
MTPRRRADGAVSLQCWPRSAAPRLWYEFGCGAPAGLLLMVHVSDGKPARVFHDEACIVVVFQRPELGEMARLLLRRAF